MKLFGGFVPAALFLGVFAAAMFSFGESWKEDYTQSSQTYQQLHGITPTEYQSFLDESIGNLGQMVMDTFESSGPTPYLSLYLKIEAKKFKAAMDEGHDNLFYGGAPPTDYQAWVRKEMGEMMFHLVEAQWIYAPTTSMEMAASIYDSLNQWLIQYNWSGPAPTGFDEWLGDSVALFALEWMEALFPYTGAKENNRRGN